MRTHLWNVSAAVLVLMLGSASLAREVEPGDDRGGHHAQAKMTPPAPMREAEPGDDRGGHGHGHDDGPGHH